MLVERRLNDRVDEKSSSFVNVQRGNSASNSGKQHLYLFVSVCVCVCVCVCVGRAYAFNNQIKYVVALPSIPVGLVRFRSNSSHRGHRRLSPIGFHFAPIPTVCMCIHTHPSAFHSLSLTRARVVYIGLFSLSF